MGVLTPFSGLSHLSSCKSDEHGICHYPPMRAASGMVSISCKAHTRFIFRPSDDHIGLPVIEVSVRLSSNVEHKRAVCWQKIDRIIIHSAARADSREVSVTQFP